MYVYLEIERVFFIFSYIYVCREYSIISSVFSLENLISERFPRVYVVNFAMLSRREERNS